MEITQDTKDRLVLQQPKNERRTIAAFGALIFLAIGAGFVLIGHPDARLVGYAGLALGIFCAVMALIPTASATLILDHVSGDLILRVPKGTGRRVVTVPFSDIAGLDLRQRGDSHTGYFKQLEFEMTDASGKRPLRVPMVFGGESHESLHRAVVRWADRNGAFPTEASPTGPRQSDTGQGDPLPTD